MENNDQIKSLNKAHASDSKIPDFDQPGKSMIGSLESSVNIHFI